MVIFDVLAHLVGWINDLFGITVGGISIGMLALLALIGVAIKIVVKATTK